MRASTSFVEGAGDPRDRRPTTPVEDTALAFGEALDRALGDRRGIARYGDASCPWTMRSPARRSTRRPAHAELKLDAEPAWRSTSSARSRRPGGSRCTSTRAAATAHHTAEAAYKAVGRALRTALRQESAGIPSTKGLL
jgi:imidazoleglycerol phosphate dehydratase HisB